MNVLQFAGARKIPRVDENIATGQLHALMLGVRVTHNHQSRRGILIVLLGCCCFSSTGLAVAADGRIDKDLGVTDAFPGRFRIEPLPHI